MSCCTVRSVPPVPCQEDFATFLGGIRLPIGAFSVFPAGTTPTGVFALAANPAPMLTPQDVVDWLNETVIPGLVLSGHTVQGVFSLSGIKLLTPVVDGGCLILSIQAVPPV